MSRKEASRASAVEPRPKQETDGGFETDPDPIEDPESYLREEMTLDEFKRAVTESQTVLEIQRATRLPRWKVKRLLHHTGMREEIASTAQRVAALRDEDA